MQDDLNELVGKRIASLREASGFTQESVAKLLSNELGRSVDPTTVTRTEKGKRPIPVTELQAYSKIFDTKPERFLAGDGDWTMSRQLHGAISRFDDAISSFVGAWSELVESRRNLKTSYMNFRKYATTSSAGPEYVHEPVIESAETLTRLSFSEIRQAYGVDLEEFDREE